MKIKHRISNNYLGDPYRVAYQGVMTINDACRYWGHLTARYPLLRIADFLIYEKNEVASRILIMYRSFWITQDNIYGRLE